MPRNPNISVAASELAVYFDAFTDEDYIRQTTLVQQSSLRNQVSAQDGAPQKVSKYGKILAEITSPSQRTGTTGGISEAQRIADLLFGTLSLGEFLGATSADQSTSDLSDQVSIFINHDKTNPYVSSAALPLDGEQGLSVSGNPIVSDGFKQFNSNPAVPTLMKPNVYGVNVSNVYLGPSVRDMGSIQVFLNSIPTLEFSKCVPYIKIDLISPESESVSLTNFLLQDETPGASDTRIRKAQSTEILSEAQRPGEGVSGIRSGMEIFTSPQTLVNLDGPGSSRISTIDRLRPLATLGNLEISTKMRQGNGIPFTTARMEMTVHDRSRLSEVAPLVRPAVRGRTFIDITYGWSHPDGNSDNNIFGKFLDSIRVTQRYRVYNSSFSFDAVGQIKINAQLSSVGSTDMLQVRVDRGNDPLARLEEIFKGINQKLAAQRVKFSTKVLQPFDFMSSLQDLDSFYAASADEGFEKKLQDLVNSTRTFDESELANQIKAVYDELNGTRGSQGIKARQADGVIDKVNKIITFDNDPLALPLYGQGDSAGNTRWYYYKGYAAISDSRPGQPTVESGFLTLGSIFMSMIARPIAETNNYEEVQVIFYPFNTKAGVVWGLPVSCFPIQRGSLQKALKDAMMKQRHVTPRDLIRIINDNFVSFQPDRAYMTSLFYDAKQASEGKQVLTRGPTRTVSRPKTAAERTADQKAVSDAEKAFGAYTPEPGNEANDPKSAALIAKLDAAQARANITTVTTREAVDLAQRSSEAMRAVGIEDGNFILPRLEVFVEAGPMTDRDNKPVLSNDGVTKTVLKIHVYDSSAKAFSTYADILTSIRDDTVSLIRASVADATNGDTPGAKDEAGQVLKAALDANIVEEVTTGTGERAYRVKADIAAVKDFISSGMPYVTYGSQNSAITSANLQSMNNSALANVELARALGPPAGDVDPAVLNKSLPMQVLPSQLSVTTLGCPMFMPMQRMFFDFGTGTSIDNVYNVLEVNHKIAAGTFTTDVRFAYSQNHVSYTSLQQQLEAMYIHVKQLTDTQDSMNDAPVGEVSLSSVTAARQAREKLSTDELFERQRDDTTRRMAETMRLQQQQVAAQLQEARTPPVEVKVPPYDWQS